MTYRIAAVLALCFFFSTAGFAADVADNPAADPKAVVVAGHARFTVLTPELIRMEWSENGQFEDHASLVFINRRLPVPPFKTSTEKGWLLLHTEKLVVRYHKSDSEFTADNLRAEFTLSGKAVEWTPGARDTGNLLGTTRTLDQVKGSTMLPPGLLSRDGWVVVDDSERPLFDSSDWPWVMPRPAGKRQDWYLFAYGHDYKKALYDFTRVAGKIPLPPRFAFGTWWSRYWAYTDQEFEELVRQFQEHDVPLDVLVIDMDWHPTFGVKWWENKKDQSGHVLGWTGYSWNNLYFPDPPGFLKWVHAQGLKATLNMHPASGVQPFEEQYPEMARAMGIDPATKKYVPFDIASKKFTENYFKILHHPLERMGIDFFWLDWQQEDKTSLPGVNPTWWLNYVHFSDMERRGKRPLLFHRWGGLGNHRYQIGFSGDTETSWESLAFQPYFTATAANVGYAYWSHDIGGHMYGKVGPELYTRWIQWGAFSPILRTHTTKNPEAERRIWAFPVQYAEAMRDAFLLRYALIPYIYTAARIAYETGISICRPLYYDYPDAPEAYEFKDEYMFGESFLIAPVTAAINPDTLLATKTIWLPEGQWYEWPSGKMLRGPARFERSFALTDIPVYVKHGSIIPMQPKMRYTGEKPVDPLILTVFPGGPGETRVYDDAGNTLGYKKDEYTRMLIRQLRPDDRSLKVEILPTEGSYSGMLAERGYEIRLPGTWPPESVAANNKAVSFSSEGAAPGWHYDGNTLTTIISLPKSGVRESIEVVIRTSEQLAQKTVLLDGLPGEFERVKTAMSILNGSWPKGWSPDNLIDASQTGRRITLHPDKALDEVQRFHRMMPDVVSEITKADISCDVLLRALAHFGKEATCAPALKPEKPEAEKPSGGGNAHD